MEVGPYAPSLPLYVFPFYFRADGFTFPTRFYVVGLWQVDGSPPPTPKDMRHVFAFLLSLCLLPITLERERCSALIRTVGKAVGDDHLKRKTRVIVARNGGKGV